MRNFITILILLTFVSPVFSQTNNLLKEKTISVEYVDAPVKTVLEQIFKTAKLQNYVMPNDLRGFVSLKLTEQPLENVLKVVLRSSVVPMSYRIENNVLIIEERKIVSIPPVKEPDIENKQERNDAFSIISLKYIDPLDLQLIFGRFINMNQFSRYKSNNMNFQNNMNGNGQNRN